MLKSFFTSALRNLRRDKVTSIINIGGLVLGLTTGLIICLCVVYMFGFDRFHENYKDIHLVKMNETYSGTIYTGSATPGPLGPLLQKEMPSLKYVVRTKQEDQTLTRFGDKAIYQESIYAEPDLFRMMSFPAIEGDPVATLREGSGAVLTQQAAARLFGAEPALGKTILLDNLHPLKVGAVIRDIPRNSTLQFDLVLPFALFEKNNDWLKQWAHRSVFTWVQLQHGADLDAVNTQITRLLLKNSELKKVSLFAYPIARLFLYDNFKDGKPYWGKAYLVLCTAFIAFLTLLIACINFMNLSTAMAERRAREVGVRKVLGASRWILIVQFLGEAVLLAMIALVLSIYLAYLALPAFAAFSELPLRLEFGKPWIWGLMILIGLFTGLVAGSYPALYLSRFQPVKVLKRLIGFGRNGAVLRKSLVTFQFVISIFLVTFTIVLVKQAHYIAERPLGYDASNLVDITAHGDLPSRYDLFRRQAENIPGVMSITASSSNMVDVGGTVTGVNWPGKAPDQDFAFRALVVDYNWTKTAGLKLAAGRDFSSDFGSDTSSCLINQTAVRKMGLKEPVLGAMVDGKKVVGVLEDFVVNLSNRATQPIIVYLGNGNLNHFLIRLTNDRQWKTHLSQVEKVVKTLNPGYPFTFRFTDDEHQQQFKGDFGLEQLANIFSVMAILISCLGLFGMSGFVIERRKKEVSIRKVLGATATGLWLSLSIEMLKPVFLAVIIATPFAFLVLQPALSVNEYHIHLSWWFFAAAGIGAVGIAFATVSYHGIRASRMNPARALQTE